MDDLNARISLVTGASRGRDIALAAAGCDVAIGTDVSKPDAVVRLVRDTEKQLGSSMCWSTMPASPPTPSGWYMSS